MPTSPLITLTTDFGTASPYVAVMKGVIRSINPTADLLDLTHSIPPQNLRHTSYFLATAVPHFPAGSIHLCVVDPGVGTERAPVLAEVGEHYLVGPDNGIFTGVFRHFGEPIRVRRLSNPRYWRPTVSSTFHGRDIFAPVAAYLSRGIDPEEFGPIHPNPVELGIRSAVTHGHRWLGEVQFIDDFGNVITNIPATRLQTLPVKVAIDGHSLGLLRWVRTYGDAATGEQVCLFSSDGFFEIAEVNGNIARRLAVTPGAIVELMLS
jgi:S-adenosylmethionine hydrolase